MQRDACACVVRSRYNHNASDGDVQCSADFLSLAEFKTACGYDGGQSYAEIPADDQIVSWAKALLPGLR